MIPRESTRGPGIDTQGVPKRQETQKNLNNWPVGSSGSPSPPEKGVKDSGQPLSLTIMLGLLGLLCEHFQFTLAGEPRP